MSRKPTRALPPQDSTENSNHPPQPFLILPASFESLEQVREFVGLAAQACGLGPSDVYQVQLAVDEAFTNIVEHAFDGGSLENVECACQSGEQDLTVILRDCGKGFDPNIVPEPDLRVSLDERKIGGLGLYLMRRMMDEVVFTKYTDPNTGKICNMLRLVKRRVLPK